MPLNKETKPIQTYASVSLIIITLVSASLTECQTLKTVC